MSHPDPHLNVMDEDADGPDTGIARIVFIIGMWILVLMALWDNNQLSALAADEAALREARANKDELEVLLRASKPADLVRMPQPDPVDYDKGQSDDQFKNDLKDWEEKYAGDSWKQKENAHQKELDTWKKDRKTKVQERILRRDELLAEIKEWSQDVQGDRAGFNRFPFVHLLVKSAALAFLLLGLLWIWASASGLEKSFAGFGLMIFGLMLLNMALGYGNQMLTLDAFQDLTAWF